MNQLVIEEAFVLESSVVEEINEGKKEKSYFIEGIFSTPDQKNRNGRVYSKNLWENALKGWEKKSKADPRFTLMELEHPSRTSVDPMKAVGKIVSLKLEGDFVKGKAKILNDNSPETNKLKALIDEGIQIGVSTRGTGRLKGSVVEEFDLVTVDVVGSPSDYNAMLQGITESIEKPVQVNESGLLECIDGACGISEGESECSKTADKLIEALNKHTKVEKELTPSEQLAKDLFEARDPKAQYKLIHARYEETQGAVRVLFKELQKIEKQMERKDWNNIRTFIGDAGRNLAQAADYTRMVLDLDESTKVDESPNKIEESKDSSLSILKRAYTAIDEMDEVAYQIGKKSHKTEAKIYKSTKEITKIVDDWAAEPKKRG